MNSLNQSGDRLTDSSEQIMKPIPDAIGQRYVYAPNTSIESIVDQYQKQANGYEQNMARWGFQTPSQSTAALVQHLDQSAEILEAGCGTGMSDIAHYQAGFHHLHGFDVSSEMLEIARSKGIHLSLTQGNLSRPLPYEVSEFDAVVCVAVLTHIEDAEPVLREFARVVHPGGKIIFSQRKDLYETRAMDKLLLKLEEEGLVTKVSQSEWMPYVTNQEDYVKCDIKVGYFVYEVGEHH